MCSNIAEAGLCQGVQAGLARLGNKLKFLTRMVFIKTTKKNWYVSWAKLKLGRKWYFQARLGLGSDIY